MADEIRQTKTTGNIVGTLSEMGLTIEDAERQVNNKTVKCKRIVGTFSIETDNGTFQFQAPNFCYSVKADGNENGQFKSWETVVNEYKPKSKYGENADRVSLTVGYAPSFSYNKTKDDVVVYANGFSSFSTSFINRVDKDTESSTDMTTECVIKSINKEVRNDEETGRLLVEIMTVGYGDADTPSVGVVTTLIVSEDLADDFEDIYEVGQTCNLFFELKNVRVGGDAPTQTQGFGRKAKVNTGFTITEKIIFGGDEPYDEDDDTKADLIYSNKEIKSLMKDFEICCEAKLQKGRENAKGDKKSKGLGKRTAKVEEPAQVAEDNPATSTPVNPFL